MSPLDFSEHGGDSLPAPYSFPGRPFTCYANEDSDAAPPTLTGLESAVGIELQVPNPHASFETWAVQEM